MAWDFPSLGVNGVQHHTPVLNTDQARGLIVSAETTYRDLVPNKPRPGSRVGGIRVDRPEWEAFKIAADLLGSDRSKILTSWIDWALYRPGADAPQRPPLAALAATVRAAADAARSDTEEERRHKEDLEIAARELEARASKSAE
ncbi:hypothetical protein GCM10022248_86530 [Nonomuraea soli]